MTRGSESVFVRKTPPDQRPTLPKRSIPTIWESSHEPQVPEKNISKTPLEIFFPPENMDEGHSVPPRRPKIKRGIPRPIRGDTTPRSTATVPRTYAAVASIAGRKEYSPTTIAAHAAEPTPDDDWVKRTPAAALIIPPPPQFADGIPTTPPCQDTASPEHPSPCPAIPLLVVECFPNWPEHLQTIQKALGHAPKVQAHGRGMIFSPRTAEEFQIVERRLIEVTAEDSATSWHRYSLDIRTLTRKQRRPNKAAAKSNARREDHARPLAKAAPREEVPPPADVPAVTATPDAPIPTATVTPDAPIPVVTNIPDAPTPTETVIPDVPTPNATGTYQRERRCRRRRAPRPPRKDPCWSDTAPTNGLDRMFQAIAKILATGMAAYLQEQGAMPVHKQQYFPKVHSQEWRTRAGGRPAQSSSPGK